jgi:hypothetical protein
MEVLVVFGIVIVLLLVQIADSLQPQRAEARRERKRQRLLRRARRRVQGSWRWDYWGGCVFFVVLILIAIYVALAPQALSIAVPGKTIELSQVEWAKRPNVVSFIQYFEERTHAPWHKFGRVVTVFMVPMTDANRIGLKISESEYVYFFVRLPGFVTVHTLADKGTYWVLCDETFKPKAPLPIDLSAFKLGLGTNENLQLGQLYQIEVAATRHLLNSRF